MTTKTQQTTKAHTQQEMRLDEDAIDQARRSIDEGAVTPHYGPWREDVIRLTAMIRANLVAERVAVESYSQMIAMIGDKDSTTRRLLEDILSDEQEHADELKDWLAR